MPNSPFLSPVSARIWDAKYRYRDAGETRERTIEDSWRRVAAALATAEVHDREQWAQRFYAVLNDFQFLPGGRILAGAGTGHQVTLFNCFVMGEIEDSLDGIFDALKEGALTMQQGGGVGYDFSTLRPAGATAHRVGMVASGPVSFMRIWDSMCGTILSTGARRGAMMATLRCDHPDIEHFIRAKQDATQLRHFNLSVLVTDDFMRAVRADQEWLLVFPRHARDTPADTEVVERVWSGSGTTQACRVYRRVSARQLWDAIMRATYDYAEPGVIFIDRVNKLNNLWYAEHISATNPCGEIPLPPYGACDLGSINLTRFVRAAFTPDARLDLEAIAATAAVATRMLDNVTDVSRFPLEKQAVAARGARRIGLGMTGLADCLIMLGLRYGSTDSLECASAAMRTICHSAYRASIALAREKGPCPLFDRDNYLRGEFIRQLPPALRADIHHYGMRNSHVTAIAPTGTISLLANNVSSGLEPVFRFAYQRRMRDAQGALRLHPVEDYAHALFRERFGDAALPPAFVDVADIPPSAHLAMQAALQAYVDSAISKTINVPRDYPYAAFRSLYDDAFDRGLKGCTTFRPNAVTGEVLVDQPATPPAVHCCSVEREAD